MNDQNTTRAVGSSAPACCARPYRSLDPRIAAARLMAVAVTLPASTRGYACRAIAARLDEKLHGHNAGIDVPERSGGNVR
jgi:hypothetical protein